MPNLRAIVTLNVSSAIAADKPQNTWHFQTAVGTTPYADIQAALAAFYNAIRGDLSGRVATNGHRTRIYDLADPEPRAPVYDVSWNFAGSTGSGALPPETALVMSFQGTRVSGVSQARRRGRVYIGPLDVASSDGDGRPATATVTAIRGAGQALLDASDAAANWKWAIRSEVDNTMVLVNNGWVDDAWDTQRRRGLDATTRQTFS